MSGTQSAVKHMLRDIATMKVGTSFGRLSRAALNTLLCGHIGPGDRAIELSIMQPTLWSRGIPDM